MKSAFDNMNDNKRKVENWIDGEISKSTSDRYEIVTDSATGEQCASVIMSTEQDVEAAIQSSRKALETWSQTPVLRRARVMLSLIHISEPTRPY